MGLDPFTAGRGCLGDIAFLLLGHLIGRSLLWDSLITLLLGRPADIE